MEPSRLKKSKVHAEFIDCKKRFDLVWNKEDSNEDRLASQRFAVYSQAMPSKATHLLQFLAEVSPDSDRRMVLCQAHKLVAVDCEFEPKLAEEEIPEKIAALEPIEAVAVMCKQLTASQKLTLFKALLKFSGDWERISREFKGVNFTPEQLKGAWRRLKLLMREEVRQIKSATSSFDFVRWLRMAIRKLEIQLGSRRQRSQLPQLIDTRKTAKRLDSLSMLATAEESSTQEMKGINEFAQSSSSSFHNYEPRPIARQLTRKIFAPDSLVLIDNAS